MKVAVIIDTWFPFVGGGQINAWEISKNLASRGVKIDIITRNNGRYKDIKVKNLRVIKLGKETSAGNIVSKILFTLKALLFLYKSDYDLVHAHAFLPGIIARLVMVFKGTPAIFTVHGTSLNTSLNGKLSKIIEKFILTQILYGSQITVSRDFLKIKNVNRKIVYIPNGVDQQFIKSSPRSSRLKNVLLFVGRLHPQKNLTNLVEAIKILNIEKFPVILVIVGDGPQKLEIQNLIKKFKLESNIKLEGSKYSPELLEHYQTASALIMPSIYEGQSLTLLEAWASKLPVIVSKTGDIEYLVKEGVNGYFIKDQRHPSNIADSIKKAFSNKNLNKLGQNGYLLVKNSFSWEKTATATLKVYENVSKS